MRYVREHVLIIQRHTYGRLVITFNDGTDRGARPRCEAKITGRLACLRLESPVN